MDKIILRGLQIYCILGWYEAERLRPQPVDIVVELWLDVSRSAQTDDISHTVDFDIASMLGEELSRSTHRLLESLVVNAANFCLQNSTALKVRVEATKTLPDRNGLRATVIHTQTRRRSQ